MDAKQMRSLNETVEDIQHADILFDEIILYDDHDQQVGIIEEGKWVHKHVANPFRVDQPTHGVGQPHAHIFGRKGKEIGVVNLDGSGSHGTKMMKLPKDVASKLIDAGFQIRPDRIVEWIVDRALTRELLLG